MCVNTWTFLIAFPLIWQIKNNCIQASGAMLDYQRVGENGYTNFYLFPILTISTYFLSFGGMDSQISNSRYVNTCGSKFWGFWGGLYLVLLFPPPTSCGCAWVGWSACIWTPTVSVGLYASVTLPRELLSRIRSFVNYLLCESNSYGLWLFPE